MTTERRPWTARTRLLIPLLLGLAVPAPVAGQQVDDAGGLFPATRTARASMALERIQREHDATVRIEEVVAAAEPSEAATRPIVAGVAPAPAQGFQRPAWVAVILLAGFSLLFLRMILNLIRMSQRSAPANPKYIDQETEHGRDDRQNPKGGASSGFLGGLGGILLGGWLYNQATGASQEDPAGGKPGTASPDEPAETSEWKSTAGDWDDPGTSDDLGLDGGDWGGGDIGGDF